MSTVLTRQEMVDKVYKHFVVDVGKPSFEVVEDCHGRISCLYRGPDGSKCAVGLFIPDEEYKSEFENTEVEVVADKVSVFPVTEEDFDLFICAFQDVHDDACQNSFGRSGDNHFIENFITHLSIFCTNWKLNYPGDKPVSGGLNA